ncbi:hypothetical protein [Streptomyces sp. NPDC007355]|uniref:hypothetical protein n=1 Tax=Streptomyces sp. NPDC007355 TaxID=3364778 RepID=UPI00368F7820
MPDDFTAPPRRDDPFGFPDWPPGPSTLAAWRQWATREPYDTARQEISDTGQLIPEPSRPQTHAEARILTALIREYGLHRPELTDGPYGITSITPRTDELTIHIADRELERWASALTAAGIDIRAEAAAQNTGTATGGVTLAVNGARINLAPATPSAWHDAADSAAQRPAPPASHDHTTPEDELATLLSATLRRIGLLWDVAHRHSSVHLMLTEHAGKTHLLDASAGRQSLSVIPLWQALSMPLQLWPARRALRRADAGAAVLDAVNAFKPQPTATDPAESLCHLMDLEATAVTRRAATHALKIAQAVLDDPAHTSIWDAGGWIGTCRRSTARGEYSTHEDRLVPPGTEQLLDAPGIDLLELGTLALRAQLSQTELDDLRGLEKYQVPLWWGVDTLIELLNWALAAATSPPHADAQEHPAPRRTIQRAAQEAASHMIAVHEATEEVGAAELRREHDTWRRSKPDAVATDSVPTIADLILAAHAHDVLDFRGLVQVLTYFSYRVHSTAGLPDGHRSLEDDGNFPNSFTGHISTWYGQPCTLVGEEANHAAVGSAAYRRHLAAHRAAFDPFVECYLAAADEMPGEHDVAERHRAGAQALRTADLPALRNLDPRWRPGGSDEFLSIVATLPLEVHEVESWVDDVFGDDA